MECIFPRKWTSILRYVTNRIQNDVANSNPINKINLPETSGQQNYYQSPENFMPVHLRAPNGNSYELLNSSPLLKTPKRKIDENIAPSAKRLNTGFPANVIGGEISAAKSLSFSPQSQQFAHFPPQTPQRINDEIESTPPIVATSDAGSSKDGKKDEKSTVRNHQEQCEQRLKLILSLLF